MLLFLVLVVFQIYLFNACVVCVMCKGFRNKLFQFSSHNEPVRYESLSWPQVAELQGRERSFHPGELQVNAPYYKAVQPPSPAPTFFFQTSLGRKMTDLSQERKKEQAVQPVIFSRKQLPLSVSCQSHLKFLLCPPLPKAASQRACSASRGA